MKNEYTSPNVKKVIDTVNIPEKVKKEE